MTVNQISYMNALENMRANEAREEEARRHNFATEEETRRANLAAESDRTRNTDLRASAEERATALHPYEIAQIQANTRYTDANTGLAQTRTDATRFDTLLREFQELGSKNAMRALESRTGGSLAGRLAMNRYETYSKPLKDIANAAAKFFIPTTGDIFPLSETPALPGASVVPMY